MNSKIESIINATVGLSSFEVNSVLGALRYNLLFRALTKTIALLPDLPEEGSGNEPHAQFEKNMRNPEITRAAAPLIGMADRIQEALEEYGTQPPSTFETVLGFALERVPSRAQFQREYEIRKIRGQEPAGGVRRFVDDQMRQAESRRAVLLAKGEAAVTTLNRIDGTDEDIGEDVVDALVIKAEDKLRSRWYAQDDRSTQSTLSDEQQKEAAGSRNLIGAAMDFLSMDAPEVPTSRGVPQVKVEKLEYQHPLFTRPSPEDEFVASVKS